MRYTTQQYAQALYESLRGADADRRKKAFERFVGILKRNRDESRLDDILRQYERTSLKEEGKVKVHVETAHGASEALKGEIERIIGKPVVFSERTDPRILAGVRILVNDSILIDATAEKRLQTIFAHHHGDITNH